MQGRKIHVDFLSGSTLPVGPTGTSRRRKWISPDCRLRRLRDRHQLRNKVPGNRLRLRRSPALMRSRVCVSRVNGWSRVNCCRDNVRLTSRGRARRVTAAIAPRAKPLRQQCQARAGLGADPGPFSQLLRLSVAVRWFARRAYPRYACTSSYISACVAGGGSDDRLYIL